MRYLLLLILLNLAAYCTAQQLSGTIVDKSTKRPIKSVAISARGVVVYTNFRGEFSIIAAANDTLKISCNGYKPCIAILNKAVTSIALELASTTIALKEVIVRSNRDSDFKVDSLNNRAAFAKQFNYDGPKLGDAFKGNANKQPGDLISVNPLLLAAVLTKKHSAAYKFHKTLLDDEHEEYIDRKFNRGTATQTTSLKGDTLTEFLIRYRPTYKFALKTTDYEMRLYIKIHERRIGWLKSVWRWIK